MSVDSAMKAASLVLGFVAEHIDVIELMRDAMSKGVSREEMIRGIKLAMTKASDEAMKRELESTQDVSGE